MMFQSLKVNKLELKNRFVVAPMTRVSATLTGCVTEEMNHYYQQYVDGYFGCIITEGLYTDTLCSQGYQYQPGLINEAQANSWKVLNDYAGTNHTAVIAQLMHAGALSQFNGYASETKAPSVIKPKGQQLAFYYGEGDYQMPAALSLSEINQIVDGFVHAACLAQQSGFSGVEIHGANGYLLDQFLCTHTNQREDEFGGSIENRLRIHTQIINGIREKVGSDFIIGLRISQAKVNDPEYKWSGKAEAKAIFIYLDTLDFDYLHLTEPNALGCAFESGLTLAEIAKQFVSQPIMVNGELNSKPAIDASLENGADLISIGKMALVNPDFPVKMLNDIPLMAFTFDIFNPIANLDTQFSVLKNKGEGYV
ncbi:NADH:flavin oxidoreductase [Shewanella sp. 202IG2-18]|uniref:oxidoreductase n=1 Tax=Parashewanella hymeniacidonis TaxID=2807618 RepID=UPI0019601AAD|nr:NADH:flavin oxidoreductase [Parashewanella hymeniacidonis]MBM7074427.1 NADH:flavin oxidoreductase [Parashewanella hymeniacidonis]